MFRIDNPSSVQTRPVVPAPGTPGWFSNGNPANAQEATVVDDWWCNQIQEEILTVIEQAGIVPSKASNSQLFEALNTLYAAGDDLGAAYLQIVAYWEWEAPKLTAGNATAYTATYTATPGVLADGQTHLIEFHIANGAAATININARGAHPINYYSVGAWRAIPPNLLGPHQQHKLAYHAASGAYRLSGWQDTTGDYIPTGRSVARVGTVLGIGQALDRVQFAGLFAAFGTTYGQGNGSTTFTMPDLRGRTVAGTDQGANRLHNQINGSLGSVGGVEEVQYSLNGQAPSQTVSGTATVAGTAATNGMDVHSTGNTAEDAGDVFVSGNTIQAAVHPHVHAIDIHGTITGNAAVNATGTITGSTGGGPITGTTDKQSNLPPTLVASYAIAL